MGQRPRTNSYSKAWNTDTPRGQSVCSAWAHIGTTGSPVAQQIAQQPISLRGYLATLLRTIGRITDQLLLDPADRTAQDILPAWLSVSVPIQVPSAALLNGTLLSNGTKRARSPSDSPEPQVPKVRTISLCGIAGKKERRGMKGGEVRVVNGTITPVVSIKGNAGATPKPVQETPSLAIKGTGSTAQPIAQNSSQPQPKVNETTSSKPGLFQRLEPRRDRRQVRCRQG